MSPAVEPLTFDDLAEVYREEQKNNPLMPVRKDLYKAMATLLNDLQRKQNRCLTEDPDSAMAEGAVTTRKKAEYRVNEIIKFRVRKISEMAQRGANGGKNSLDGLPPEDRELYDDMIALIKNQYSKVDRLKDKKMIDTRIDLPPARDSPQIQEETIPETDPVPPPVTEAESPKESVPDSGGGDEQPYDSTPVMVRILEDLPTFAGPDRSYSLSKEDLVILPKVLSDALVRTEKAVVVVPSP